MTNKTQKKIEITYFRMRKNMNKFLRMLGLYQEGEGVYVKETITGILKKDVKLTKQMKNKIIKGLIELADENGIEMVNFEFKIIETL